jgi:pimeloyl-ACP methyl ester carboxylesterase
MNDPVVLIPGLMCDARAFLLQLLHLGRDRLVTIALPIHGTTVEEMAKSILSSAPPKFALVGMGLGGEVALEMLRRAAERLTRIALISTDPLAETPSAAAAREARIVTARAGRLPQALAEEIPDGCLAYGPMREPTRRLLAEMWQSLGAEVFQKQSRALQRRPDHQRTLRAARLPVLVIAGAEDTLVPVRRQEFTAGLMPFARVEVIPGAGHLPPIEAPAAVSAALEGFLKGPLVLKPAPLLLR